MIRHGLMLSCILVTACASGPPERLAGPPDGIRIAIAGPLSGEYAEFGDQMEVGATQAVEDINAAGGVLGRPLTLYALNDRCDPGFAKSAASQAVEAGIVLVAGHFCSATSIPASDVYAEAGVVQISPASTNPRLTERGLSNVFRVVSRDDQQARLAADYVAEHKIATRIAIVDDQSGYGRLMAEEFEEELRSRGLTPVMDRSFTPQASGYGGLIAELQATDADLLYFGGYPDDAGRIISQAKAWGLPIQLIGPDSLIGDEYWRRAGEAGQDTLVTFGPDPTSQPSAASVVSALTVQGHDPGGYVLYTYAAIQVFAQAAEQAGTTDAAAVSRVMHAATFDTVLGQLSFDDAGDVQGVGYAMYQWDRGAPAPVP